MAPAPQANADKAREIVDLLLQKEFAAVGPYLDTDMQKQLPTDVLAQSFGGLMAQIGAVKKQGDAKNSQAKGAEVVVVTVEFEKATLDFSMSFDEAGKVDGLFVKPAKAPATDGATYQTPAYARPEMLRESEVTVGAGTKWALPATLTMPVGTGNPAIVLVHGSGPNDRDETHLNPANKPFKDLALGLASRGIAVLRYEKRTKVYGAAMVANGDYTVQEETVDDALAAVQLLRQTPGVDAKRIYVLGHSLGGYLAPRIGARDPKIAGFVVLAGSARPLEEIIVEQNQQLAMLDGTISKTEQKAIAKAQRTAAEIKALTPRDRAAKSYYGAPASYWLDLNGYNAPQSARSLSQPMLILQGERDIQVTLTDYGLWKGALQNRQNVSFVTYPKLNHLFMTGNGAPSVADYDLVGHVDAKVIADIAMWLKKQAV